MEFSEEAKPRWTRVNLRRPEFQLLNPIAGVCPTPLLSRFESSAGAPYAIPASNKILGDRYMMKETSGIN
jgi:hypothetical protein